MSAGDVVCTGWLIKSPPERKLLSTRYSWRKRWFVLRQGRMSGNPDVLEYYRTKCSKKPIRAIDLQECEVRMHSELQQQQQQQLHRRQLQLQNQHLFVVKTTARAFYLLAKTQEEMTSWVKNISQICTFGVPDDTDSADSLSQPPSSQQPSPVLSPHTALTPGATTDFPPSGGSLVFLDQANHVGSHTDNQSAPDYLILSQCQSGTASIARCNSSTNSDHSLEQSSSETAAEDFFLSPSTGGPLSASPLRLGHASDTPFSAPCSAGMGSGILCGPLPFSTSSTATIASPCSLQQLPDVFSFDPPFCLTTDSHNTPHIPPPLPPKPTPLADAMGNPLAPPAPHRHRASMPSLDILRRGEPDSLVRRRSKIASLHLPALSVSSCLPGECEDSYVPMASPPVASVDVSPDGYIPMSPTTAFARTNGIPDVPPPPGVDMEPPPVNRDLKPRRRARPPPLDLRGLSTITEHPSFHLIPLVRTYTEPSAVPACVPADRRWRALTPADTEGYSPPSDNQLFFSVVDSASQQLLMRSSRLDYLSLDFNSASPSPVLKKPLLADEHRVDYVQVDEKKTQALKNTTLDWKDVRQSKV